MVRQEKHEYLAYIKEGKGRGRGSKDPPHENFTLILFIQYNVIKYMYTHRPKRLWQTKPFGPPTSRLIRA